MMSKPVVSRGCNALDCAGRVSALDYGGDIAVVPALGVAPCILPNHQALSTGVPPPSITPGNSGSKYRMLQARHPAWQDGGGRVSADMSRGVLG